MVFLFSFLFWGSVGLGTRLSKLGLLPMPMRKFRCFSLTIASCDRVVLHNLSILLTLVEFLDLQQCTETRCYIPSNRTGPTKQTLDTGKLKPTLITVLGVHAYNECDDDDIMSEHCNGTIKVSPHCQQPLCNSSDADEAGKKGKKKHTKTHLSVQLAL